MTSALNTSLAQT